ncbi:hypothetical protein J2S32_003155 [Qipengyuania citrea]|nr:hypothetical protein [Qipengyuania citrea]
MRNCAVRVSRLRGVESGNLTPSCVVESGFWLPYREPFYISISKSAEQSPNDFGAAHLALIDSDDPLEAGLEIFAQPPGKKLQSLTLLSGGEQALTATALIFALFLTNPAPICVLDEVDAPLDDANIDRFCDLLDAMTRETQTRYLIVSPNAMVT